MGFDWSSHFQLYGGSMKGMSTPRSKYCSKSKRWTVGPFQIHFYGQGYVLIVLIHDCFYQLLSPKILFSRFTFQSIPKKNAFWVSLPKNDVPKIGVFVCCRWKNPPESHGGVRRSGLGSFAPGVRGSDFWKINSTAMLTTDSTTNAVEVRWFHHVFCMVHPFLYLGKRCSLTI